MNILFVTPPPSLPNRLHRNRSFDLIRLLARKHQVHLLAVTSQKDQPREFVEIQKVCKSVTIIRFKPFLCLSNVLLHPLLPAEVAYCISSQVKSKAEKIIKQKNIDLIYLKRLRSATYLPNTSIPAILDSTDAMSLFYQRMANARSYPKKLIYLFESYRYLRFEKQTAIKVGKWVVCSQPDQIYLKKLSIKSHVVNNPVDTTYFRPSQHKPEKHTLLFRGLMDKPVNINAILFFAKKVFPKVVAKFPDAKLYIVGPNPIPVIRKLNSTNIFVTGFVPDIRTYLHKTAISICTISIGAGTRFKITQAWAVGRPVISTTIGAEGLDYKHGDNILIANDPSEFVKSISLLFQNLKVYNHLVKRGLKTVAKKYSLPAVEKQLNNVLNTASHRHR